mgnify:CR=1 FL=1
MLHIVAASCVLIILYYTLHRQRASHRKLYLVSDDSGNESLILDASLAGRRALFMLDTAYAGAPVVSETYAAVQSKCSWGGVKSRFKKCMHLASRTVDQNARNVSVDRSDVVSVVENFGIDIVRIYVVSSVTH